MIKKEKKNMTSKVALGLVLGGALSNLFDRIFYGFVVDYIDIIIWPVFNLSDMCINVGVGIFLFYSLIYSEKRTLRRQKK